MADVTIRELRIHSGDVIQDDQVLDR